VPLTIGADAPGMNTPPQQLIIGGGLPIWIAAGMGTPIAWRP
jgi:hypothetical protein